MHECLFRTCLKRLILTHTHFLSLSLSPFSLSLSLSLSLWLCEWILVLCMYGVGLFVYHMCTHDSMCILYVHMWLYVVVCICGNLYLPLERTLNATPFFNRTSTCVVRVNVSMFVCVANVCVCIHTKYAPVRATISTGVQACRESTCTTLRGRSSARGNEIHRQETRQKESMNWKGNCRDLLIQLCKIAGRTVVYVVLWRALKRVGCLGFSRLEKCAKSLEWCNKSVRCKCYAWNHEQWILAPTIVQHVHAWLKTMRSGLLVDFQLCFKSDFWKVCCRKLKTNVWFQLHFLSTFVSWLRTIFWITYLYSSMHTAAC
jgi:hypothetical protein